jgi:hypothetical protein
MDRLDLLDLLNAIDEHIATIRYLAEIGPALDGQDTRYFPHALALLSVIATYAADLERVARNLGAQLRALDEGDAR